MHIFHHIYNALRNSCRENIPCTILRLEYLFVRVVSIIAMSGFHDYNIHFFYSFKTLCNEQASFLMNKDKAHLSE